MLLEQLLSNLSVDVEPFAICEVAASQALSIEPSDAVALHYVLDGRGTISVGSQTRRLSTYQLALVRSGRRQTLTGVPAEKSTSHPTIVDYEGLKHLRTGEPGTADMIVACGHLTARYATSLDLFRLMPDLLLVDFSQNPRMRQVFDLILDESTRSEPGSTTMLQALMSGCLVDVFRALCEDDACHLPWLDALEDDRMARVVDEIISHPGRDFSVEHLADLAAMSRSSFSATFTRLFDRTPMAFVRETRLRRAAELLARSEFGVAAVANRVGYESRSHFSSAFKEHFGVSPSQFRNSRPGAQRELETATS